MQPDWGSVKAQERELLDRHGIHIVTGKIARAFSSPGDELAGVELESGQVIPLRWEGWPAFFLHPSSLLMTCRSFKSRVACVVDTGPTARG